MADNINVTPGTGKTVIADEVTDGTLGTGIVQYVKVMDGTLDGTNKLTISSSGEMLVKGTIGVTTASKIQTEFATAQPITVSTASAVQVEPKAGASFTIGALTTASKIQTEFAAAQAVTLTTASKVQTEFAAAQPVTLTTASALQVEPKAGASFTIAALTTSSKINVEANSSFAITALTTASKIQTETFGNVASGSADSGAPLKVGGKAATALPTTVASGNRVDALYDTLGRQIVSGTLRENLGVSNTAVTTAEVAIVSSTTGLRDIYGLVLANYGSVASRVDIRDSNAGTIRCSFYVPATDTRGFMLPVDSAIPQASTGAAWTAQNVTTTATMQATAMWVTRL